MSCVFCDIIAGKAPAVRVYEDANGGWVPTRSIWNQHAYSITNINDDLSVPRNPEPSWKSHNTFRLNRRMDADPGYNSQADDQVDADMEQAQLRLEQLRKEKEEVENSRRRLEECHMRKARFMDQQNELGDRMVNAADLIGREVESLRQESNELEQIHMALTRSLKMLSTVRPDEWPIENTDNLISQGQQVIDRCEEEFADAVQQCARMQHTKVLTGVRRSSKVRISSREFMTQFLQGLSFHLPLLLIALIILFFIWIFSPSAS